MRSHGVNVPDPTSGADGSFGFRGFRSVDRKSPAFQARSSPARACASRFGNRGGGPGGPPGGGGPPPGSVGG